jgi:hypothetical protein
MGLVGRGEVARFYIGRKEAEQQQQRGVE